MSPRQKRGPTGPPEATFLCNLDADNILTVEFCDEILRLLADADEEALGGFNVVLGSRTVERP